MFCPKVIGPAFTPGPRDAQHCLLSPILMGLFSQPNIKPHEWGYHTSSWRSRDPA
jgi:hypothetical protein